MTSAGKWTKELRRIASLRHFQNQRFVDAFDPQVWSVPCAKWLTWWGPKLNLCNLHITLRRLKCPNGCRFTQYDLLASTGNAFSRINVSAFTGPLTECCLDTGRVERKAPITVWSNVRMLRTGLNWIRKPLKQFDSQELVYALNFWVGFWRFYLFIISLIIINEWRRSLISFVVLLMQTVPAPEKKPLSILMTSPCLIVRSFVRSNTTSF